jgi:hypothetical protein
MDRRNFLAASGAVALAPFSALRAQDAPNVGSTTRWVVRTSEGFDALGFLSPLSGDPFYQKHYEKEVAEFAPRMPSDVLADIKLLKKELGEKGELLSPAFYLYFSGGPDATMDDLLDSITNPQRLRPALEASPYWDAEDWAGFVERLPRLKPMLEALRDGGFREYRNALVAPQAGSKLPVIRRKLADYDVIKWAQFYTGRAFDPTIEVIFMHFNKPHGIKIVGPRFLTGLAYRDDITIQTAGHEVLHPPVPMDGAPAKAAMALFEKDPLLRKILDERDKSYGYGDIEGLFNEGLTQTIDQLIGERLGLKRDPGRRWREHDGGMHVLAAAFYGLMRQDGFAQSGGNLERWVERQVMKGNFAPARLHAAAGRVLELPSDHLWRKAGAANP